MPKQGSSLGPWVVIFSLAVLRLLKENYGFFPQNGDPEYQLSMGYNMQSQATIDLINAFEPV